MLRVPEDRFIALVRKGCLQELEPSEAAILQAHPEKWRDELVRYKQLLDNEYVRLKAESLSKGVGNRWALTQFHKSKAEKHSVMVNLQTQLTIVNGIIRRTNTARSQGGDDNKERLHTKIEQLLDTLIEDQRKTRIIFGNCLEELKGIKRQLEYDAQEWKKVVTHDS